MADSNVTLQYEGDYDGSKVIAGLAEQDNAFVKAEEVVKDSFGKQNEASAEHARIFGLHHQEIRRTLGESTIAFESLNAAISTGTMTARQGVEALSVGLISLASLGPATILMGVGLAIAFITEHLKLMNEEEEKAAQNTAWFNDSEKVRTINEALNEYDQTMKGISESSGIAAQAQARFKEETGISYEALVKANHGVEGLEMRMTDLGNATITAADALKKVNDLEANRALISAQGNVAVAKADNDPIARQKAEGEKRIAEFDNQQEVLKQKAIEYNAELAILNDQYNVDKNQKEKDRIQKEIQNKQQEIDKLTSEQQNAYEIDKLSAEQEALEIKRIKDKQAEAAQKHEDELNKKNIERGKEYAKEMLKIKHDDVKAIYDYEKKAAENKLKTGREADEAENKNNALQKLEIQHQKELSEYHGYRDAQANIDRKYIALKEQLEKESMKKSSDDLAANMKVIAGQWHEFGILYKAAAEEKNIADTWSAAEASYAWASTWGGPIAGAAAAAVAAAAGLANGTKIAAASFEAGGPIYGPSHSGGGVPIIAEGGENMWSRADVSRAGGHEAVESMKRGGSSIHAPISITITGSANSDTVNQISQVVKSHVEQLHDWVQNGRDAVNQGIKNFTGSFS